MRNDYRRQTNAVRFVNYLYKTWRNKVTAMVMVAIGMTGLMMDKDATLLVIMSLIAVPMFFSNKNWLY